MSDPHGSIDKEAQSSPGWTFVNSQGDIMSGDEDSESSESSIEVLSFEGIEGIIPAQLIRSHPAEDAVMVTDDTPITDAHSEDENMNAASAFLETQQNSVSDEGAEKPLNSLEAVVSQDTILETTVESFPDLTQTDLSLSEGSCSGAVTSRIPDEIVQEQSVHLPEVAEAGLCCSESQHSVFCETTVAASSTETGEVSVEAASQAVAGDNMFQANTEDDKQVVSMNATEDISQSLGDAKEEEPQEMVAGDADGGACCMALLLEGENAQSECLVSDAGDEIHKSPISFPLSFDDESIAKVSSLEGTTESSLGSRTDSDADSDFVRLDSDNMDAYVGENQFNEERIMIPLRLYRSEYTIGPGFNFIRDDERGGHAPTNELPVDNIEQDRDEDTESSTEEGIDDRIESEQSEAGSLSAQNDVGDLSVFADIGDLPLVAGDVPRNYIHRPNNHLSTVLNIIVVLVAILTMGISLGIIMATDMEIEEWQNAYEFQNKKVNQLEILLKGKTKAHDLQLSRVRELEVQVADLKNSVWNFERRAKNYERAVETLSAYSSLEGGTFGKAIHTILDGMKDYIQCQTESNQLVALECHLKLLPYIRNYTALIKHYLPPDEPTSIDRGVALNTDNQNTGHFGAPSQEMTAEVPDLAASSQLDDDSLQSQEKESSSCQKEHEMPHGQSDSEYIFVHLERSSDEEDSLKVSSASHENRESDQSSHEDSKSVERSDQRAAKETFQASPVPLDIKQLQQSLTREQERALHWQKLYLSERRQKERERDNEELEDEREREMAERERAQMDQVECLKKLMSANLTTLTQHVIRWNVSVFDDFANLSMLLSGISDLQQAVLDSVQRVWSSAEQVIDSLHSKDPATEEHSFTKPVPRKEDVVEYLGKLLDHIKKVDMPDHDVLVDYLGRMLDQVKHGVEDILNVVFTESLTASLNNVLEDTEQIIQEYQNYDADGGKAENTAPNREHLLEYLSKVLNDICHKDDIMPEAHSAEVNNKGENVTPEIPEKKSQSDSSFTGPQLETPFGGPHHKDEDDPIKHGFWSRRIGKMLKKTGKTVRKLGRKVTGTWGKIKAMWHEKKPAFFKMGNGLASTIKKASSKFAKMCKKMSSRWFKTSEITNIDIDSKYVYKLRKHWQALVMNDPCQILGKFSYECNVGKKQCQQDLKKISDSFSHLLKIPNVKRDHVLKLKVADLKNYYRKFKSFQDHWWKSKLLLTTDKQWVDCQLSWWTAAVAASYQGSVDGLEDNRCYKINLSDNFYEEHHGMTFGPNFNIFAEDIEEQVGCMDDNKGNIVSDEADNVQSQQSQSSSPLHENDEYASVEDDDDFGENIKEKNEEGKNYKDGGEPKSYTPKSDEAEVNETSHDASDWLQEQAKLQLHLRKEKEKARSVFEQAADKNKERQNHWNGVKEADDNEKFGDWFFEKSKDREHQRDEAGKSSWVFERAARRRDAFHRKWMDDRKKKDKHNRGAENEDDWFMKQAEERQKIREDEHKSDWVFERAADRKRHHDDQHNAKFRKHHCRGAEHGKQFRHAYGKVSTP
ncbi:unnamed protein product [Candidula unifasciata]|uniref:Uncharacterized protein n=1 Tax=Candidula unifasciata TaxID=100452 RepID=A0A8S3YYN1_9EUPU|nr:unnamed protein product [Candidula unifasciata]